MNAFDRRGGSTIHVVTTLHKFSFLSAQYSTTEPLTGANDSYLAAVCLDMPLGEAMAQVPLGAIAGHLQTQKELFLSTKVESMSELCGESIEGCVTSKKKHSVKRKPPQSAENNTGSAADQPKKKRAPPKKKQASKETEHQDAMDLQQQQQIHQQQSMYQQPSQQCLPSIANLLPPISGYQKQQNETMIPSCFPYTDRNGVAQEVSGSGSLQEPCASSSSTYQTYNISMNKQDRPNKQQSLASMLKPLTCSSASALPPQQTVDNSNYQTLYSMGPGGEGEFYARYEGQSDYNGPLSNSTEQQFSSGDGHMQYAPLSVESHISYQSQESNAPNSHMSSMPPTPISNASHGSAYSTNPVTNDSQISMSQQNYGLMHSESTTSHHQFQPDLYTQKFLTPMENPHVNYLGTTQQQKSHQSGDPQSSTASSSSNHVQPVTELQSLTPTDIAEFFSASDHQTNGGVNSSIKAPRPREMTPDTSNVQYLANGRKEIINMCGEDDECEMSTCPADCNKCQTKGELAGPNVALEKETNVANGSVLPPPDSEQVSYVQYLPQQHTNSTLNGSLNFLPALPHLKKSKSKSKKRLLMNQLDMDQATLLEKIGRNVPIEGSASNMSIGELLKKNQHLSSSAFANLSFNALSNLSYSTAMNAMNASMTPNSSFSKLSSKTILHSFTKATNGPNSVGDSHLPSNSTDHTHQTAANPVLPAMSNAMNNSTSTTKYSSMPNPTHSSTSTPKSNTRTRNNVKIRNNTLATLNINLGSSQSPIPAVQPEKSDLPEEHDPNKRDSVSETIDTVISNVMGTGDSLQRYLPITALNIPASIKSQHVKTIEKTNQCIASLAKASLQKSKKRSVLSKTLQGAPKRGQQEIDLHYAQIRGNNILRQESSSSCANVSIGMYCNQEDQVPSGKDLPKPPERELTLVERLKQPPQQTVEKKPSGVQGPCSPLYQDKRKPPAVVIQHYDLPTIPQQKISKMLVEPPAHFNNHVQQQLDFKNLTEKEKMQLFRTPSPHIAQEISQKIPKQEMLANSLDASSKSKSQATRRQVSVDIPRETPSPALTRPSSAPCTVPKLPNVTDSKINPKPPTSKSSEEDAEKILQIIKEKMASEANKSDFVMPTERPLPNIGGARTNHVRDIIRYVISVGPLLPEEALGIHEPDCEDFEKEYLEHYESISQMMIEEPCKPEICVDDVLENPEFTCRSLARA
uniref:Uncharacterized protein n=1 Tax=Caenorhabditis japonica TaxID=281687 RepID=A0A8R1DH07_CAEJA